MPEFIYALCWMETVSGAASGATATHAEALRPLGAAITPAAEMTGRVNSEVGSSNSANGHTMLRIPVPVRSQMSSSIERS